MAPSPEAKYVLVDSGTTYFTAPSAARRRRLPMWMVGGGCWVEGACFSLYTSLLLVMQSYLKLILIGVVDFDRRRRRRRCLRQTSVLGPTPPTRKKHGAVGTHNPFGPPRPQPKQHSVVGSHNKRRHLAAPTHNKQPHQKRDATLCLFWMMAVT